MGGIPVTERVILRAAAEDPRLGLASLVDTQSVIGTREDKRLGTCRPLAAPDGLANAGGLIIMSVTSPQLDNWYQDPSTGKTFRVVAVDRAADSIEVQYFNGDLSEYDFPSWSESEFRTIAAPEDWTGPYDELEPDDLGYTDPDRHQPYGGEITLDDLLNDEDER
jgi:hypothetical protein